MLFITHALPKTLMVDQVVKIELKKNIEEGSQFLHHG